MPLVTKLYKPIIVTWMPGVGRWLDSVTNVFWSQASASVTSFRIDDHPDLSNKSLHVFK